MLEVIHKTLLPALLQVPGRNMGGMPNAGTGPSGGPSNPNFGMLPDAQTHGSFALQGLRRGPDRVWAVARPGYMDLPENLRGLQGAGAMSLGSG